MKSSEFFSQLETYKTMTPADCFTQMKTVCRDVAIMNDKLAKKPASLEGYGHGMAAYAKYFKECSEQNVDAAEFHTALINYIEQCHKILFSGRIQQATQNMIVSRMQRLGYAFTASTEPKDPLDAVSGHCYGLTYMGLQAFFVDRMQTWDKRVQLLAHIPLKYFSSYQDLSFYLHRLSPEAIRGQARETLTDLHAFFDGVSVYQNVYHEDYAHLFIDPMFIQDANLVRELLLSAHFDQNDTKKPTRLHSSTHCLTETSIQTCLRLIREPLCTQSFSLVLSSRDHAILVNYDHHSQQWMIADPNHLRCAWCVNEAMASGVILDDLQLDREDLEKIFQMIVYVEADKMVLLQAPIQRMLQSAAWTSLSENELSMVAPMFANPKMAQDTLSGFSIDLPWIIKILEHQPKMNYRVCETTVIKERQDLLRYMNQTQASVAQTILLGCFRAQNLNKIAFCLEAGVRVTAEMVDVARAQSDPRVLTLLLDKAPPLDSMPQATKSTDDIKQRLVAVVESTSAPDVSLRSAQKNQLLRMVAAGMEPTKIKILLQRDPTLLLETGDVRDHAGRTFKGVTAFQLALWAGDREMWCMMEAVKNEITDEALCTRVHTALHEQLQDLIAPKKGILIMDARGRHHHQHFFDTQAVLTAYEIFLENYDLRTKEENQRYWITRIGVEQARFPANLAQEFCRLDRPLYPTPSFTEPSLPRSLNLHTWLQNDSSPRTWWPQDGSPTGLGVEYAVYRGTDEPCVLKTPVWVAQSRRGVDKVAVAAFSAQRKQDIQALTQRLTLSPPTSRDRCVIS